MRRLLKTLLGRLAEQGTKKEAIFRAEDVQRWPDLAISLLLDARIIREISLQDSMTCQGCEERCWRPIEIIVDHTEQRFQSTCQVREAFGPFNYTPRMLRRFAARRSDVARFVARELDVSVRDNDADWRVAKLGIWRAEGVTRLLSLVFNGAAILRVGDSDVPLIELLTWDSRLTVDREALLVHLHHSHDPQSGGKRVQPSSTVRDQKKLVTTLRNERLQSHMNRLAREHPRLNKRQLAQKLISEKRHEGVAVNSILRITRLPPGRRRK
jgi:hypothetical protein